MHIAYVCSDLGIPISGTKGASIHVRSLAQALTLRGHRVTLLAAKPGTDPLVGFHPEIIPIGYERTLKRLKRNLAQRTEGTTTAREVHALLLGSVAHRELCELHRRQRIDAIYERHSLWSWAALAFAREHDLPHVLELNAPLVREHGTYRGLELGEVAEACERHLVAGASAVVVPSQALANHAARLGASRSRVHVLPNAIDPELFRSCQPLAAESVQALEGRFVVAFVGSLKPWHGIDVLLDAFAKLTRTTPKAHLLVIGDGPLKSRVDEVARELGPERVTVAGAVPHQLVPAWLDRAHVGVAPYPQLADFYFSPMKVVEYQAAGLAVVASDIGHLRQQINDMETGLLVGPGDATQLAGALARLARQPELMSRLGRQARSQVLEQCTWAQVADRVTDLMGRPSSAPMRVAVGGGYGS